MDDPSAWAYLVMVGLGLEIVAAVVIGWSAFSLDGARIWAQAVNVRADARHVNERGLAQARIWAETKVGLGFLVAGVVLQGIALVGDMGKFQGWNVVLLVLFVTVIPALVAWGAYKTLIRWETNRLSAGRVLIGAERLQRHRD